nr:hypothetical protein GCM10020093_043050 [Planobispora longispora]
MLRTEEGLTAGDLSEAKGFVFDAGDFNPGDSSAGDAPRTSAPGSVIDRLQVLAEEAKCRIVILVTEKYERDVLVVEHEPADAMEVFRRWLAADGSPGLWTEHRFGEHLSALPDLLAGHGPARVREYALEIAARLRDGRRSLPEVLGTLRLDPRERLRQEFRRENADETRQCFLISAGVLHGLSEAEISGSALRLAELVREVENDKDRRGPRVWGYLHTWLNRDGLSCHPPAAPGEGHRVLLRQDPTAQILSVAWEEAPVLRGPLYAWLHELTGRPDERIAIRAAQGVAHLAACDFRNVRENFLDGWSKDGAKGKRDLVKYTLEAAALNPALAPLVHELLDAWSTGNLSKRTTATVVYGSEIGVRAVSRALEVFRRTILLSPAAGQSTGNWPLHLTVTASVAEIYTSTTAERVLAELGAWARSGSPGLRRTAAFAFVWLACLPSSGDPDRPR